MPRPSAGGADEALFIAKAHGCRHLLGGPLRAPGVFTLGTCQRFSLHQRFGQGIGLAPVAAQLSAVAEQLRAEAAELAMIAARKIAGAALDRAGEEAAAQAITEVVRQLKLSPNISVSVAPEAYADMERRLEQLRAKGIGGAITFVPDPRAKLGDWRVTWAEGSAGFSREGVEAAIDAIITARLQDPVAPQLDLFSAA